MSPERVIVCTVATEESTGLANLRRSCDRFDIPLTVFGVGATYRGHCWRSKLLYHELCKRKRDYEYVLHVDGYDSLFAADLAEIMTRFHRKDTPLLFAAEPTPWPFLSPSPDEYPPCSTPYRYLNAGGYVGVIGHLTGILREVLPHADENDDQIFWAHSYVWGEARIDLDHHCEIFQCLKDTEPHVKYGRKGIRNRVTGTRPCIIHGNGGVEMKRAARLLVGSPRGRLRSLLRLPF